MYLGIWYIWQDLKTWNFTRRKVEHFFQLCLPKGNVKVIPFRSCSGSSACYTFLFPSKGIWFFLKVCLEGEISKSSIMKRLARGKRASGDLIPWTISQQVFFTLPFAIDITTKPESVTNWDGLRHHKKIITSLRNWHHIPCFVNGTPSFNQRVIAT